MAVTEPTPRSSPDAAVDADRSRPARRRHPALGWSLILVASLIGFRSLMPTWVHRPVLHTQSWEDASAELLQDPQVGEAVSVSLVSELYATVDVAAGLQAQLPPNLKPLAGPVAGALRQPATNG